MTFLLQIVRSSSFPQVYIQNQSLPFVGVFNYMVFKNLICIKIKYVALSRRWNGRRSICRRDRHTWKHTTFSLLQSYLGPSRPLGGKPNMMHLYGDTVYCSVDTYDLPLREMNLSLEEGKEVITKQCYKGGAQGVLCIRNVMVKTTWGAFSSCVTWLALSGSEWHFLSTQEGLKAHPLFSWEAQG